MKSSSAEHVSHLVSRWQWAQETMLDVSTDPYALVVDDDALILMDACDIIEAAGFRVYMAGTGDEALTKLEESAENITLLFTDVEMPGDTNGFQLAQVTAERWPQIEIVVASGRIAPQDGDLPKGATFISKPFSASLVHEHLQKKLPDGKKPTPLKKSGLTLKIERCQHDINAATRAGFEAVVDNPLGCFADLKQVSEPDLRPVNISRGDRQFHSAAGRNPDVDMLTVERG